MSQIDVHSQSGPIFVVGAPRSGTTLCARILGNHGNLFAPGETHYMEDIFSRKEFGNLVDSQIREKLLSRLLSIYNRFNEPGDQTRVDEIFASHEARERLVKSATSHGSAFDEFMTMQSEVLGKSRWINHAPKDLFYIRELAAMYSNARFIFCFRDPRDFLLSYKMKWRATADSEVERIKSLYHPVLTTLLWKASARRSLGSRSVLNDSQVHFVLYEALVNRPAATIEEMCRFIDEPYHDSLMKISFKNSSHSSNESGIHTGSIGRGRKDLSRNELWWIESLLKEEMQELGYDALAPRPRSAKILIDVITFPIAIVSALIANRHNTGPIIPYLIRRLRSFFQSA